MLISARPVLSDREEGESLPHFRHGFIVRSQQSERSRDVLTPSNTQLGEEVNVAHHDLLTSVGQTADVESHWTPSRNEEDKCFCL